MTRAGLVLGVVGGVMTLVSSMVLHGQSQSASAPSADDGPVYQNDTHLVRPLDYREWTFLSSGLSMTYADEGDASENGPQRFQNVFVNPSSYRHFKETGTWKDGTTFVLEIRAAATEGSINIAGRFQTNLVALEAEVKDSRFEDGWGYFAFGQADDMADVVEPLSGARVARCVECHTTHTAVERTFVQFYPEALSIAREKGTLNPGF